MATAGLDGTTRIYPYLTFAPDTELLAIASARGVRELTRKEKDEFHIEGEKTAPEVKPEPRAKRPRRGKPSRAGRRAR